MTYEQFFKKKLTIQEVTLNTSRQLARPLKFKSIKRSSLGHLQVHSEHKIRQKIVEDQFLSNLLNLPQIKGQMRVFTDQIQKVKEALPHSFSTRKLSQGVYRMIDKQTNERYNQKIAELRSMGFPFSKKTLSINNIKLCQSIAAVQEHKGLMQPTKPHFFDPQKTHLHRVKNQELPKEINSWQYLQEREQRYAHKRDLRYRVSNLQEAVSYRKPKHKELDDQKQERIEGWGYDLDREQGQIT